MENEVWKLIPGFKMEASNLGRIRDLDGRIRGIQRKRGYLLIETSQKKYFVHRLVMLAFVGPSNLQVDHLNGIRHDNRLENLEYVTGRENVSRAKSRKRILPTGVSLNDGRYRATIRHNHKTYNLGSYATPKSAGMAYQAALNDLDNIEKYAKQFIESKYGYGVKKSKGRFQARVKIKGKNRSFGCFSTAQEASEVATEVKRKIDAGLLDLTIYS